MPPPPGELPAAIGPGLDAAGLLTAVTGVPIVFPDGRLPGPRWRWLGWSAIAATACLFLGNAISPQSNENRQDDLTGREREVLDLLAEGSSNRQIARAFGVSLKTVPNHVSRILDKLQAADRIQAALRTQAALRARGLPSRAR